MTEVRDQYFDAATSWATNAQLQEAKSRRTAWIVAGLAGAVALLEGILLVALFPLKQTETVAMMVDRTTGFVQRVDPERAAPLRADEALLQSLLAQYVNARESFDRASVQQDYRKAALWSSGSVRRQYMSLMESNNSQSPFNRLAPGEAIHVTVKSVSQIEPGRAFVRFDTSLRGRDGSEQADGSWISLVSYQFSDAAMSYEDRLLNPLGLQVIGYRKDSERPSSPASILGEAK